MPRRLGDDPLTRARSDKAKAAEGSAAVAVVAEGQEATTRMGLMTESRASYNDVFFQRRGAASPQQAAANVAVVHEEPEISEISEIPEIRDAAASVSHEPLSVTAEASPASPTTQESQVMEPSLLAKADEVTLGATSGEGSSAIQSVALPETKESQSPPALSQGPSDAADESKTEPQKGGFFKRLFGKFK